MAELGPNYNIQCMKLFQELKASFPNIPDSVVRQFMKQVRKITKRKVLKVVKD